MQAVNRGRSCCANPHVFVIGFRGNAHRTKSAHAVIPELRAGAGPGGWGLGGAGLGLGWGRGWLKSGVKVGCI